MPGSQASSRRRRPRAGARGGLVGEGAWFGRPGPKKFPKATLSDIGALSTKRMEVAFAHHLLDVAQAPLADEAPEVVLVIDNAPWHRRRPVDWALGRYPHLSLYRMPPHSPEAQPIERLWRPLRRRATHNVLFEQLPELQHALRLGARLRPSAAPGSWGRPNQPRRESGAVELRHKRVETAAWCVDRGWEVGRVGIARDIHRV